jgi:hypothetical protein
MKNIDKPKDIIEFGTVQDGNYRTRNGNAWFRPMAALQLQSSGFGLRMAGSRRVPSDKHRSVAEMALMTW